VASATIIVQIIEITPDISKKCFVYSSVVDFEKENGFVMNVCMYVFENNVGSVNIVVRIGVNTAVSNSLIISVFILCVLYWKYLMLLLVMQLVYSLDIC